VGVRGAAPASPPPIRRIGYDMESSGDRLNTATTDPPAEKSFQFNRKQSIILVFFCTLFAAAAQILIKSGANTLQSSSPLAMITNLPLMAGYSLYGIVTLLLVLALRDGELSILYPVISLTYVWVAVLSVVFFHEAVNPFRVVGVLIIVTGVAVLGKNGKQ